jgi:hypothetical protein
MVGNFVVTGDAVLRFAVTEYLGRFGISLFFIFPKQTEIKAYFFKQGDQFTVHVISITICTCSHTTRLATSIYFN